MEFLTTKFSQLLLNDSLTLRLNDLQQSEFSAYWQAQQNLEPANFFMDATHQKETYKFMDVPQFF